MHECTCEKNPKKQVKVRKYSTIIKISGGVNNAFNLLESALGYLFQTWHHTFSYEEQKDLYKSLETAVKSTGYDLVIKTTCKFK